MKRLAPGVYDDEQGGMHIDLAEVLVANGWPDSPHNRELLLRTWREFALEQKIPITVTDKPVE